nr:MAG TPA: hypothetical protein [Caudoviricetes sp.]
MGKYSHSEDNSTQRWSLKPYTYPPFVVDKSIITDLKRRSYDRL